MCGVKCVVCYIGPILFYCVFVLLELAVCKWRHRRWQQNIERVKASYLRGSSNVFYADGQTNKHHIDQKGNGVEVAINPIATKSDPVDQIILPWHGDEEEPAKRPERPTTTRPPSLRPANKDEELPIDEELPEVKRHVDTSKLSNRMSDRGLITI